VDFPPFRLLFPRKYPLFLACWILLKGFVLLFGAKPFFNTKAHYQEAAHQKADTRKGVCQLRLKDIIFNSASVDAAMIAGGILSETNARVRLFKRGNLFEERRLCMEKSLSIPKNQITLAVKVNRS